MPSFALLAAGADRPGIVAAVTGALGGLQANLADTSMVALRGTFAMVLVVEAPEGTTAGDVERVLAPVAAQLDLAVAVRPASPAAAPRSADASAGSVPSRHTLTVYGADHPGIVHGITARLAAAGANVVDLETSVIGAPDRPVYAMVLDLALAAGTDVGALEADLAQVAAALGVSCTLRAADADIL